MFPIAIFCGLNHNEAVTWYLTMTSLHYIWWLTVTPEYPIINLIFTFRLAIWFHVQ